MTTEIPEVNLIRVLDPIVDIPEKRAFGILQGCDDNNTTYYPHQSGAPTNQMTWTIPQPQEKNFLSRDIKIRYPIRLTFAGTSSPGKVLLQKEYDAFRANPLSRITSTMTLRINSTTVNIEPAETQHVLERIGVDENKNTRTFSLAPTKPDTYQRYSDGTNTIKNPLGSYDSSDYIGRGAFPITYISNTATDAVIDAVITENVRIPPCVFGYDDKAGFCGVNTLTLTLTFTGNWEMMWSHALGCSVISSITGAFGVPDLLVKWTTPTVEIVKPRETYIYPYYQVEYWNSPSSSVVSNASTVLTSQSLDVKVVPSKIIICAERRTQDRQHDKPDVFSNISALTVDYGNRTGLLATMNEQQLFNMSRDNGYAGSWVEWHGLNEYYNGSDKYTKGLTGSIAVIEMGKDIPLGKGEAPGMLVQGKSVKVRATITNIDQVNTTNFQLKVIFIYPGTFKINAAKKTSEIQLGIYDQQNLSQMINSTALQTVPFASVKDYYGGELDLSALEPLLKMAYKLGKPALKGLVSLIPGVGPMIAEVGEQVADAVIGDGVAMGGVVVGGARKKLKKLGGGEKISKKALKAALKNL